MELEVKSLPANAGDSFDPWVRKIPWRKIWQTTPLFLSGESHGQRTLAGYTVLGVAKSQTQQSEFTSLHTSSTVYVNGSQVALAVENPPASAEQETQV